MASYWICALFTMVSASVSLGYSIAAVRAAGEAGSDARYTLVRSTGLAAVAATSLIGEHGNWLVAIAVAMIVVQAGDAIVGLHIHNRLKTAGPAATALINLLLLAWYLTA